MNIIRKRLQKPAHFHSDAFEAQRLTEVAEERCGQCWDLWPKSVMKDEDGKRRCPDCIDVTSAEWKAMVDAHDADRLATRQTRPQVSNVALNDSVPPFIREFENASGTTMLPQSNPLVLAAGGAAKTLIVKGGDFASTDSFSYSTGISDSVAPSLSGTTQWTLTLVAAGGTSAGLKHLTFNNHTYRNLLMVS